MGWTNPTDARSQVQKENQQTTLVQLLKTIFFLFISFVVFVWMPPLLPFATHCPQLQSHHIAIYIWKAINFVFDFRLGYFGILKTICCCCFFLMHWQAKVSQSNEDDDIFASRTLFTISTNVATAATTASPFAYSPPTMFDSP